MPMPTKVVDGLKPCARCGQVLPVESFYRRTDRPGGYLAYCKPCMLVRQRQRYVPKERSRQSPKQRKEGKRAAHRKWYSANRERILELERAKRQLQPEVYAATQRRYRDKNPQQRNDRLRHIARELDGKEYLVILANDPCSYCGESSDTVDHIRPRNDRVDHHWTNLTAACRSCNGAKRDKPLLAYLDMRLALR